MANDSVKIKLTQCWGFEFFELLEEHMNVKLPLALKNILKLNSYDSAFTLSKFDDDSITEIQDYMRNVFNKDMIGTDEFIADYLGSFLKNQNNFILVSGEIRLLRSIAEICHKLYLEGYLAHTYPLTQCMDSTKSKEKEIDSKIQQKIKTEVSAVDVVKHPFKPCSSIAAKWIDQYFPQKVPIDNKTTPATKVTHDIGQHVSPKKPVVSKITPATEVSDDIDQHVSPKKAIDSKITPKTEISHDIGQHVSSKKSIDSKIVPATEVSGEIDEHVSPKKSIDSKIVPETEISHDIGQHVSPKKPIDSKITPATDVSHDIDQHVSPKKPIDSKITPKTKVYISHIDKPDRFYLQIASNTEDLDRLHENIQRAAAALPPLENFNFGTRCIVQYSFDNDWYRAAIIDSDTKSTFILFIDYGNTDTITDKRLIKRMDDAFDQIPAYAIPCALPLEPTDRNEWSEESCQLLKDLVNDEVEFEYICKGKDINFVKLYHGERDVMEELIQNGHAIKLEPIKSGEKCCVSHVNAIYDFYIVLERERDAFKKIADYLMDESKFEVITDIKNGVVCAAKYIEDGLWYRAKILSHTAEETEVFFIDYGNSSLTRELRTIPTEIANTPALAKRCSMVKPKDIKHWSENAEERFIELTLSGTIFVINVINPGKHSTVDLITNGKSILDEISDLCPKDSLLEVMFENDSDTDTIVASSETFKASIIDGTPDQFYIRLESSESELDRVFILLESASEWPALEEIVVGQMCAAFFQGYYYRARILSLKNEGGAIVQYVDYGNKSISTDLRKLPEEIQNIKDLAILCSLESKSGTFSQKLIERFENLSKDDIFEMKFVSQNSNPALIQLFENGILFAE